MKLMLRSYSNLLASVRRVTQENQGKRTAGIDGQVALTPKQRVKLVRGNGREPALDGGNQPSAYTFPSLTEKTRPFRNTHYQKSRRSGNGQKCPRT